MMATKIKTCTLSFILTILWFSSIFSSNCIVHAFTPPSSSLSNNKFILGNNNNSNVLPSNNHKEHRQHDYYFSRVHICYGNAEFCNRFREQAVSPLHNGNRVWYSIIKMVVAYNLILASIKMPERPSKNFIKIIPRPLSNGS